MSDELDRIIANLSEGVKYKNEILEEGIQNTNWDKLKEVPLVSNHSMETLKNDPIAQINKAYNKIEEGARLNKLTDSFRLQMDTETESATAISLEKAIARYARQYTILQATR